MPLNESTILQMAKIYSVPHQSVLNIKILSVQQQQGMVDCGVFSIANAVEVCLGNNPEHITYDQAKMREHLFKCFTIGFSKEFYPRITTTTYSSMSGNRTILSLLNAWRVWWPSCDSSLYHIASELRNWVLYYSIPVLYGILQNPYFNNYANLVAGIQILTSKTLTENDIEVADSYLADYYKEASTLYGTLISPIAHAV